MGLTFAEKVLSEKAGREVRAGEIISVEPDAVLSHDNSAAISKTFASIGVSKVKYPERLVIVLDHCVPAADDKHAGNHKTIREFVAAQGISHFYDINYGVCHQVLLEQGLARPGSVAVGSDSHTTSYGAVGAFSAGIGRTEAACTWATGELWLRVPETLRLEVSGAWPKRIASKDLMLHVAGQITASGADYMSVEWTGPAIQALTVESRFTLCNMSAEIGAKNGYVPPDDKVAAWFAARGVNGLGDLTRWHTAADAVVADTLKVDIAVLAPQVAKPHRVDNVVPVGEVKGQRVHQCLLGTCTNGRLEDIEAAWEILDGRKVDKNTRLIVFPASQEVNIQAIKQGLAEKFMAAGAVWMNPGCGPCLGAHEGALAAGEACISTANRNFKGRMGNPDSSIYLASPQTVAACAITGEITDPREV